MAPESAWGTILVILFVMGVAVLLMLGRLFAKQRHLLGDDKQLARDEFAELMSERLGTAMRAAELDKIIVDKWAQWPLEYRPALYQVLRHTQLLEETMYEEAVEVGVYPRRLFDGNRPVAPPTPPQPPYHPSEPPPAQLESTPPPNNVVAFPTRAREWIGGQLLKVVG